MGSSLASVGGATNSGLQIVTNGPSAQNIDAAAQALPAGEARDFSH